METTHERYPQGSAACPLVIVAIFFHPLDDRRPPNCLIEVHLLYERMAPPLRVRATLLLLRHVCVRSSAMTGIAVKETTFSWHMTIDNACHGRRDAAIFSTAKGTAVWPGRKIKITPSRPSDGNQPNASVIVLGSQGNRPVDSGAITLPKPTPEALEEHDEGKEGGGRDKAEDEAGMGEPRTEASAPAVIPPLNDASPDVVDGSATKTTFIGDSPDLINPRARASCDAAVEATVEGLKLGDEFMDEAAAAATAAHAALAVIRKSVIRRRGTKVAPVSIASNQSASEGIGGSGLTAETTGAEDQASKKICSTPFVIRRASGAKRLGDTSLRERESQARARVEDSGSQGIGPKHPAVALTDDVGIKDAGEVSGSKRGADRTPLTSDTPQQAIKCRQGNLATPDDLEVTTSGGNKEGGKRNNVGNGRGTSISKGRKRAKAGKKSIGTTAAAGDASDPNPETTSPPGSGLPPETSPAPTIPAPGPSKIQVTFSATGSLGMGLDEDDNEPGTVVLAGKSPTCAAAHVPDGWRITEVDGKDVRRLGGEFSFGVAASKRGPVRCGGCRWIFSWDSKFVLITSP